MEMQNKPGGTGDEQFERAVANRSKILAIILVGIFIGVLDVQIVAIALPTITHDLNAPLGETQWIATAYVITVLATVLIFGRLSGSIGNGRLFKTGLVIFTISSFACGLSATLTELILFRVLQALGASMLMSICIAIIMQVFPVGERGRAMGFYTAVIGLGMIIGPAAGGFIVDTMGWPFIFFVNVPIGICLLAGSAYYLTFDRREDTARPHDIIGAVLLVALMAALALALDTLANLPVQVPAFVLWSGLFLTSPILFVFRERTAYHPLVDIRMLAKRAFLLPAASLILFLTATFILLTALPFYFEIVMNFAPSHIGLISLITPGVMILCAPLFGWLYDRVPWTKYTFFGLVLLGIAYIACGAAFALIDFWLIILLFIIIGIARSIFQGPNSIEIMAAVPPSMLGIGSSLIISLQYLGIMFGVSLTAIFLTTGMADSGYTGPIMSAGPALFAGITGQLMMIGGIILLAGAACSFRR